MFRRILGLFIMLISVIVVVLLIGGAFYVGQLVDSVGGGLDNMLTLTLDTLNNVAMTLEQTKATIVEANYALETASEAAVNLSLTMDDMQPLIASTTKVVAEDVPNNIESIQDTIPNIAQVAGVIDGVLRTLSNFGIERTIPIPFNPITIDFDLGIDYEPEESFDQTIYDLDASLAGMPEELRSLQADLDLLSNDLGLLTGNIETAATDIEKINAQVALFVPILDEYLRIVDDIEIALIQAKAQISNQLDTAKLISILLLVFLGLTQLAPIYLGWELVTGQRSPAAKQETMPKAPPPQALSSDSDIVDLKESGEVETAALIDGDIQEVPPTLVDEQAPDSSTVVDSPLHTAVSQEDESQV